MNTKTKKKEEVNVDAKTQVRNLLVTRMHQCFEREPQAHIISRVDELAEDITNIFN